VTQLLLEVKKITDFKSLPDGKIREAIQKMKRKLKLKTDEEFYYYIKFQPYSKILFHQYLCDVLNTRSKFFKDEDTFEILRKEFIPEIIRKREDDKSLRILFLGCRTGEEFYSFIFLMSAYFWQVLHDWDVVFYGVEPSDYWIKEAKKGVYNIEKSVNMDTKMYERVFRVAKHQLLFSVDFKKKMKIRFENLPFKIILQKSLPDDVFDIILCREMIFREEPQNFEKLLNFLKERLREAGIITTFDIYIPDGYKFFDVVKKEGRYFYRK